VAKDRPPPSASGFDFYSAPVGSTAINAGVALWPDRRATHHRNALAPMHRTVELAYQARIKHPADGIGDAYLEKGKKDTRRTFLCLIGEKGKVLLTFFTDK
jgi:hypothetical protein